MKNDISDSFVVDEHGHGIVKPTGRTTLNATVDAVDDAIGHCRDNGIRCLLADLKDVDGFPSPSLAERFEFISRWAGTSQGRVFLSVVAKPEMILEDKFGVLIAANRGLVSDVFTDHAAAHRWLDHACQRFDEAKQGEE